ncbi:hypothetical protein GRJ2_001394100 [Grus japonensis]|uniref:Uncharacterized protein n=1 Tax=Grus japonensis TaxID=30415 RepID=A0ABC9WV12_GRUJA
MQIETQFCELSEVKLLTELGGGGDFQSHPVRRRQEDLVRLSQEKPLGGNSQQQRQQPQREPGGGRPPGVKK